MSDTNEKHLNKDQLSLSKGDLPTALQFFAASGRSGILQVHSSTSGAEGIIYFRGGKVIEAEAYESDGIEAVGRIISWGGVQVELGDEDVREVAPKITLSVDQLLLEASMVCDHNSDKWEADLKIPRQKNREQAGLGAARLFVEAVLVFTVLFCITFGGKFIWEKLHEKQRQAEMREADTNKKITLLLKETREAMSSRRYNKARDCLKQVNKLGGTTKFEEVFERFADDATLEKAAGKRSSCLTAWEGVKGLDPGQKIGEQLDQVENLIAHGEELIQDSEFRGAMETYDECLLQIRGVLVSNGKRKKALARKLLIEKTYREIRKNGSGDYEVLLESVNRMVERANREFDNGKFIESFDYWDAAEKQMQKLKGSLEGLSAVSLARAGYEFEFEKTDQSLIQKYGAETCREIQQLVQDAVQKESELEFTSAVVDWEEARTMLVTLRESSEKQRKKELADKMIADIEKACKALRVEDAKRLAIDFDKLFGRSDFYKNDKLDHKISSMLNNTVLRKAITGRLEEIETAAKNQEWLKVYKVAAGILELEQNNKEAEKRLQEAEAILPAMLKVEPVWSGGPITDFSLKINGNQVPIANDYIKLADGVKYRVQVQAFPVEDVYFLPWETMLEAEEHGVNNLTVNLKPVQGPSRRNDYNIPGINLVMKPVPIGFFERLFFSPDGNPESVCHAEINAVFMMSAYEITQDIYSAITGESPSAFQGAKLPVESVTWDEAVAFCKMLTERERSGKRLAEGWVYRLPSELEWEYACKADAEREPPMHRVAWYNNNSGGRPRPAGSKDPNGWGFYDMHGNVLEWCENWMGANPGGEIPNAEKEYRACRGGGWSQGARECESIRRYKAVRTTRSATMGFRVILAESGRYPEAVWSKFKPNIPEENQDWLIPSASLPVIYTDVKEPSWISVSALTLEQVNGVLKIGGNATSTRITLERAEEFCERLTALEKSNGRLPEGYAYRLPEIEEVRAIQEKLTFKGVELCRDRFAVGATSSYKEGARIVYGNTGLVLENGRLKVVELFNNYSAPDLFFRVILAPKEAGAGTKPEYMGTVAPRETKSLDVELVLIGPGEFMMGSVNETSKERPVHPVELCMFFWISKYEITQRQYELITGMNPSLFTAPERPVQNVYWANAMEFCEKLTRRESALGNLPYGYVYRLPTEAEWEYCARSGDTPLPADPDVYMVYGKPTTRNPQNVGSLRSNSWGLFDMYGNVSEWVYDWFAPYPARPLVNPAGSREGFYRVCRGGDWKTSPEKITATFRDRQLPSSRKSTTGFRIVLAPPVGK